MIEENMVEWIGMVVAGLAAAVTFLYRQISRLREDDLERLEARRLEDIRGINGKLIHCEEQHEQMNTKFILLSEKVGHMEGLQKGRAETMQDMEKVVSKITDRIINEINK